MLNRMNKIISPSLKTKAKIKSPKAKTWWKWNKAKRKAKKNWTQFRVRRKIENTPWMGVGGGILAGMAGLWAFFALKKQIGGGQAEKYAQSGQAPSRSHIQMSSHPAAQSRFLPLKKAFGG
ncbi:MAG: hypothetical protein WDA20_01985 [Desulfuromonadales bacterium]